MLTRRHCTFFILKLNAGWWRGLGVEETAVFFLDKNYDLQGKIIQDLNQGTGLNFSNFYYHDYVNHRFYDAKQFH